MTDHLLTTLYEERSKLIKRLTTIDEFINKLGGDTNSMEVFAIQPSTISNLQSITTMHVPDVYSQSLSWKEKIAYALNALNKPSTAEEIMTFIRTEEPDIERLEMVTQYCSSMLKNNQLVTTGKRGKKYLYELKRQPVLM